MSDPIMNESGTTELRSAAYHGELDWVQNCIKGGLDVNARDEGGWTPLHWVADMGMVNGEREAIVTALIEAGADVNAISGTGESVVCRAALAGNHNIVRLLIEAGADVNVKDERGNSPLSVAMTEDEEMIDLLKKAGAHI